ncbi:MAG TPA: YlmC/YmxH family sporulation protein [Candidatus Merdisoma merdipullorum]|nr:YlmC/YmxH family sporulation protein [Candidatus Merdisoma merdipullorum]
MTFCELREKDVINIRDCKRLGHVADLILDPKNGCILALITSASDKLWGILGKDNECEIPWCKIKQIGPDIILVDLEAPSKPTPHPPR